MQGYKKETKAYRRLGEEMCAMSQLFAPPGNLAEALAYLREGRVRVEPLVSEAVPLEALPGHFQNRLQGRIQTLVRF
mgnify:FL=1